MEEKYKANDKIGTLDIIDIDELKKDAEKVIPAGGFGYIGGGAGDEWTMRENTLAFEHKLILPRVLASMEDPDLGTSVFGTDISLPIIMAPLAAQGLAHVSGESGTARGVAESDTIMAISNYASQSLEEISAAGNGAPQWFQIYLSKDEDMNDYLLDKAVSLGMKAVVLTADATVGGNRESDLRNKFVFPMPMPNLTKGDAGGKGESINKIFAGAMQSVGPEHIRKIAAKTKLPVIVKGVQSKDDVLIALDAGASGIWVSNHGGRQLDGGPGSFDVLSGIAEMVNGKVPVIFDSGVRRGQHVFKALASGADIVAIGRPAMYGLALGGWMGVKSVFGFFRKELQMVMQLAGTKTVDDIKKTELWDFRKIR